MNIDNAANGSMRGQESRRDVFVAHNRHYTAKHTRAVHRLFKAHGMDVLGPPLELE